MSLDIASIRAGIATTLAGIPEILRVDQYAYPGEGVQNLPFAQIFRGDIQMPLLHQPDIQLGSFDATITWTIKVFQNLTSIADAQALDDIIAQRLLSAFDGNMLIDPNGPGVVDESRITYITPLMEADDRPQVWIATATLMTFSVFTP
jgi:hypothetical protein